MTRYAMQAYRVRESGNFRDEELGRNDRRRTSCTGLASRTTITASNQYEQKLFTARESRPRPFRDDKVLADWNGLMIAALALGARALDDDRYLRMAAKAASFIRTHMLVSGDRLMHRYRGGEASVPGNLDDYAFVVWGLVELYQAGYDPEHLDLALRLSASMLKYFSAGSGGLLFAPLDGERLVAATVEDHGRCVSVGKFSRLL